MGIAMKWGEVRKKLLEDGFVEIGGFRIDLTLDNTFLGVDYIPRIVVYWEKDGRWHILRNPIPKGETLDEGWRNAVQVLEGIITGKIEPDLGEKEISREFARMLRESLSS